MFRTLLGEESVCLGNLLGRVCVFRTLQGEESAYSIATADRAGYAQNI